MAAEPPWGNPPQPPPPAAAPTQNTETSIVPLRRPPAPARREVTRADLEALVESKFDVKARRGEQREARCPAHEDKRASLGLKIVPGDDGGDKIIVKCQAGCPTGDVLAAVGLTFADLFTVEAQPSGKARRGGKWRVVATYPYTDEKGVPLYAVVRFEPKDFRQHALNPDGSRPEGPWSITGIRRVLYRLPRVLEAIANGRPVWIVEGEKDVAALEALGLYATCNMGGAANGPNDRKWLPEYADSLAGAPDVLILPDNDEPGRRHAETIRQSLEGRVGRLTVLDLAKFWPGMPEKGDVSDYLAAHPGPTGAEGLAAWAAEAWAEEARRPATLAQAGAAGPVVDAEPVGPEEPKKAAEAPVADGRGDWRALGEVWDVMSARLISKQDRAGVLHIDPCPYNAGLVMDAHPEFEGRIRYDEFANKIRFKPPGWWLPPLVDRFWDESDTVHFRMWADKGLCAQSPTHFGRETIEEAVLAVGKHHVCHPLREWLESLVWDGKERLPFWLEHFCGAEAGQYTAAVGVAWVISAVARIMEPGCQADHMLVLRGPQGIKKTSLFRVLGGPYYASMQGVKLEDKDAKQKLLGKWIVEFAELEALHRSDVSTIKAYLTETSDHFRLPYRRDFVEFSRQCVFAGTINQGEFLKDETGNRRFWIVECGTPEIDTDRLATVRDQLFAEAVARYKRGEKWWLVGADAKLAEAVQQENLEAGLYDETIAAWLADDSRGPGSFLAEAGTHDGERTLTLETVMRHALKLELSRWTLGAQKQVAGSLTRAGWRKRQFRIGPGTRTKAWLKVRVEQVEQQELVPEDPDALPY